ncbi:cell division cycle protein 23 isoform X2 [Tachypleus tridentatus]|uniref:cell division cycle protein 23 isoform X2 n=1 Tax=Tachypleus tridentatus TaxID=6853 RepID=UPI003FD3EF96
MAPISTWNLFTVKRDLLKAHYDCSSRGLRQSAKWSAEMSYALSSIQIPPEEDPHFTQENPDSMKEWDKYLLAKSYFDVQEYDRAAYFSQDCVSPKTHFLHLYSRYLSGEKKKLDDMVDTVVPGEKVRNEALKPLRAELQKEHLQKSLDGYLLYLYGVILKRLQLQKQAIEVLCEAVHKEPLHWGAWLELATLIIDREMLSTLSLPNHWIKEFFLAHAYLELQLNEEALDIYTRLQEVGFLASTYLKAQVSIAYHNMRVDQAIEGFQALQKVDPYRLDNTDIFSNLLYVKEMKVELSFLAHQCCETDKYRVQTCCVIGNFYSLRSQHEKAVLYFQRALRLNPNYLSAWTLMGHEYMEMKNTQAAIQSYRQAIEVNRRDYRAWYGLGQTYEMLKMPFYCLYYYRLAQQLRPNDSRMMVALGEAYEKLDKLQEAKKCYWKAHSVGDIEGMALIKLAKLYDKLGEEEQAAAAYSDYVRDVEFRRGIEREEQSSAFRFLAGYYKKHGRLEEAYENAQKCTEYSETREEAKALLREIAQLRSIQENGAMQSGSTFCFLNLICINTKESSQSVVKIEGEMPRPYNPLPLLSFIIDASNLTTVKSNYQWKTMVLYQEDLIYSFRPTIHHLDV